MILMIMIAFYKKIVYNTKKQSKRECLMNSAQEVSATILSLMKQRDVLNKQLLGDLGLGKNFLSHMADGHIPSSENLAKIADYLNCSMDYLMGRTDKQEINN